MGLSYILKNIVKMNFNNMKKNIVKVHKITGKNKIFIFADMINCAFKYGAGHVDYSIFGMYNLNKQQRKTILTRGKNCDYVRFLNPKSHWHYFNNKLNFLDKFKSFIDREYLNLNIANEKSFFNFISKHPVFMAKPISGQCGQGIEKINSNNWPSKNKLYLHLKETNQILLEQIIKQHEKINEIFNNCVNTIRIVTIVDLNDNIHIVFACMRIGTGKGVVDNFNSGGISVVIDTEKGQLTGVGVNKKGETFSHHPDTNVKFNGFAIPFWQQSLDLVLKAAALSLPIRYIGWDVAITPEGPVLVEGNHFPGHDLFQLVAQNPEKKGMLERYNKIVPYEMLKSKSI